MLDLVLANRTCTHTKVTGGGAPENLPCRAVSQQVRWNCRSETAPLQLPIPANGVKPALDVWRCHAAATSDLDLTPRSWALGQTACIKVLGGRGGVMYEP